MTEQTPVHKNAPAKPAQPARRKPRKFGRQAKTIVSAAAVTALIGGWNLVAHLDNAQATTDAPPAAQDDAALALTSIRLNTPTPTPWPTLAPLAVTPVATLAPGAALPGVGAVAAVRTGSIQLPAMAALAPLPDLAPLPSMPSLPPPPSGGGGGGGGNNGGGGGNSGGGGAQNSGGS